MIFIYLYLKFISKVRALVPPGFTFANHSEIVTSNNNGIFYTTVEITGTNVSLRFQLSPTTLG